MTLDEHLQAVKDHLAGLETEIDTKKTELGNLNESIAGITKDKQVQSVELEEAKKTYTAEKRRLEAEAEPLRKEVDRLKLEMSTLVNQKTDLKKQNIKLWQENNKMKAYEDKAWKILKAKDAELISREKTIREKEHLKTSAQTLLPLA